VVLEHLIEVAHPKKEDVLRVASLDVAILLHEWRLGDSRHGSSTTNGCPPTFALRRCRGRTASSRVAQRPTRPWKKPVESRNTRASNPITSRRVSMSSTWAVLFT